MSVPRRSRVLLPVGDGTSSEDRVFVEIPPTRRSHTFSISYPDQRPGSSRVSSSVTTPQRPIHDYSDGEGDIPTSEEGGSENEYEDKASMSAGPSSTTSKLRLAAGATAHPFQQSPHFSRTMSMPLPSQLSYLQHPLKPQARASHSHSAPVTPPANTINLLSVELADSFQMIIQTMLQISPPQVLESTKEQYSACSLSVPTPSMSAIFTAMKTLNYMSANLARFYSNESGSLGYSEGEAKPQNVFDIGELLQGVGDALSGVAAHAGVDLILYHKDVDLRHVHVKGDECGISYALLHIIRQILDKARTGDSIELGLTITYRGVQSETPSIQETSQGRMTASPVDMDSLRCSIKIEHKYRSNLPSGPDEGRVVDQSTHCEAPKERSRKIPQPTSPLLRRLLRLVDAQFTIADNAQDGQTYEVSLLLDKAASPALKPSVPLSSSAVLEESLGSDTEPSAEQLLAFGETLKGRKVTLYAGSANSFTQHITSYLAAWNMDVNHVFSDSSSESSIDEGAPTPVPEARISTPAIPVAPPKEMTSIAMSRPSGSENQPQISFVLIDDDVGILREQLHALRVEQHPLNLNARARPSLAALHRPRSSPQIARALGQSNPTQFSVVILHFTSLSNFKATKDVIQSVMSTYTSSATPLPEVMIIPKPVGPRRFLTSLHTAVTRPTIDPFFSPTATSPGTPSIQFSGSFFPAPPDPNPSSQTSQSGPTFARATRPHSSRTDSDRSTKEHTFTNLPSPSPLGIPDNVEYFPDPIGKLGPSASSGFLVSSPDGQPAGILFHPRSKRNASPQPMERTSTQTTVQRPGSTPRLFSGREGDTMSFSALHEAAQPSQGQDETTAVVESPKISASPIQDGTSIPGRRSPLESPGNENGPSKKAIGKRPAHEKQDSVGKGAGKKGKAAAPSDGNIVPPISVLIVDDNPINQTILSTFMKRKKIRYGIANNGKEAVEKWKTGGFHLILMDIQMPIMNGIEATREIRRMENLNASSGFPPLTPTLTPLDASIPPSISTNDTRSTSTSSPYRSSVIIVALTASSLQSDRVNALAAGCNDFLTKPVSLLWLNNKIIEWGSIKALQMWADIRPEAVRRLSRGQAAQARAVAARLHMPQNRNLSSKQPLISQAITALSEPSKPMVDMSIASASTSDAGKIGGSTVPLIDPMAESPASMSFTPPRRRRSQKRESAPDSIKAKSTDALEAYDIPRTNLVRPNDGGIAVVGEQDQDHNLIQREDLMSTTQPDQVALVETPQSINVGPPPQSPTLGPR